jgi:hypothetical protein
MGMNAWVLTEENFEEFVIRNLEAKILMWSDNLGNRAACSEDQLRELIGFRWC